MAEEAKSQNSETPETEKTPLPENLGVELGADQNLPFAAPYRPAGKKKDNLQELLQEFGEDLGPDIKQLIAMRRTDGQARALYRLLTLPIRSALTKATFVPEEGGEAEAEFIEQVFNLPPAQGGMSVTFHKFMAQMLSALFDGFSAFEQVYWQPEFGPLKGKYTLKKLAHRPPETITFVTDKNGGFAGIRQRTTMNGKSIDVFIPADRAFYYAAQEEERKFYGVSFFQSAFYHYDKKVKMYYIAHLAAQRAAVGTRVGTVPPNAPLALKREFASALANLSFAQYMLAPENFKVEVLKESGSFSFLEYINHHNNQMSKSVLAGFFDEGNTGKGAGDASLVNFAQPGDDMFVLMLRSIMDEIANQINHYIIPRLIDWNFKDPKYPKFTWGALTDEQKGMIASTFDKLASSSAPNVTSEFMRELEKKMAEEMGLEIDYDEIEAQEELEAQELKDAAAAVAADPNALPEDQTVSIGKELPTPVGAPVKVPAAVPGAPVRPTASKEEVEEFKKKSIKLSQEQEEKDLIALAQRLLDSESDDI